MKKISSQFGIGLVLFAVIAMSVPASSVFAAIAFGSVTSAANEENPGDTDSLTIAKPASTVAGDFLIAGIAINGGDDVDINTIPSGWTLIERTDNDDDLMFATYYKFAGGSEPADYTWTFDDDSPGSPEVRAAGGIIRYTGVHSTDPIDEEVENEGFDDDFVAPSVSTTFANARVVVFYAQDDNGGIPTPAGTTERYDVENEDNSGPNTSAADFVQALPGATGTKSVDSGPDNEDWIAQTIALREAESLGTLVVRKQVTNDNGGTLTANDFYFQIDGGSSIQFSADGEELDGENVLNLPAGTYDVDELEAVGYDVSYTNCQNVIVTAGATSTCEIANNDQPAELIIVKDANGGDATFGFTVAQGTTTLVSPSIETTGGAGETDPILLDVGTYTVTESLIPEGWDYSSSYCSYEGGGAGVEIENGEQITVGIGQTVTCTFHNDKRATLSIVKYTDPAVGEFQFDVTGPSSYAASTTFAPQGEWNLSNLIPGAYTVSETILSPEGWTGSQAIVCGGDGMDDPAPGSLAGGAFAFNLTPGDEMACYVNNTQDGLVSGKKFEDMDGNDPAAAGPGLAGWTIEYVQLDDPMTTSTDESVGGASGSTVTSVGGDYSFLLQPGIYEICEDGQANWYQSYPQDNGGCYELTVAAGSNTGDIDFGNFRTGTIAGTKWHDQNADGLIDETEPGLSGWTIELLKDGSPIDSEVTVGGVYQFTDVDPGNYTLREILQAGWARVFPGGNGENSATLTSNGAVVNENFGNVEDATISGYKWHDLNGNGVWDEAATSTLSNWRIFIDVNGNGAHDYGTEPYDDTDGDGAYSIAGLLPGTYTVRESLQEGWGQTFPSGGAHTVTLEINEDATDVNFGNVEVTLVTGKKWHDMDGDGIIDPSTFECVVIIPETPCIPMPTGPAEPGLEGWEITATPVGDPEGRTSKTAVTNSAGEYEFEFIPSDFGNWILSETHQSGWTQTWPLESGTHEIFVDDSPASPYHFGNWENPTIEVFKWNDANGNGQQDEGEVPLELIPMALGRVNGPIVENNIPIEIVALSLTGSNGVAQISAPTPGQYVVLEAQAMGWQKTYPSSRPEVLVPVFAPGVGPAPLVIDSFFDVFVEIGDHGQTINQGQRYVGEGFILSPLEFGNLQVPLPNDGGNNISIAEFQGGGGPQGPQGGGGGQVLGAATTTDEGTGQGTGDGGQQGAVLGESCTLPLTTYLRRGGANDPAAITDLQNFLNAELGLEPPLPLTGFFGPLTEAAVKAFQLKYYDEILKPWVDLGLLPPNTATGVVFKTTLWKIQSLGCPGTTIPKPELP